MHLGTLLVKRGEHVTAGEAIAEPGPSGDAEHDLPYLHLGIRLGSDDDYVDPLTLLPPRSAPNPPPAPAAPPAPAPQPVPADPPAAASAPTAPSVVPPVAPSSVEVPAPAANAAGESAAAPPTQDAPGLTVVSHVGAAAHPRTFARRTRGGHVATSDGQAGTGSSHGFPVSGTRAMAPSRAQGVSSQDVAANSKRDTQSLLRVAPSFAGRTSIHDPRRFSGDDGRGASARRPRASHETSRTVLQDDDGARLEPSSIGSGWSARVGGIVLLSCLGVGAASLAARRVAGERLPIIGARARSGATEEDPGRRRVAVCERPPAHRPRGGIRRPVGHLRPVSPTPRQPRPHGQRNGRARDARHGRGGRGRRVAA